MLGSLQPATVPQKHSHAASNSPSIVFFSKEGVILYRGSVGFPPSTKESYPLLRSITMHQYELISSKISTQAVIINKRSFSLQLRAPIEHIVSPVVLLDNNYLEVFQTEDIQILLYHIIELYSLGYVNTNNSEFFSSHFHNK